MARKTGSVGEETAELILKESLALFARHGYAAVSMRQIAGAVGVQASAIYQYFPTKQAILVEVLVGHMNKLLEAWEQHVAEEAGPENPIDRLIQFTRFHIGYHIKRPDEVFISYMELRALEEDGFKQLERLRKKYENSLREILISGASEGVFKIEDAHVSSMAVLSMITGVNTWFRSGGRLSQKKISNLYVDMVLGAVGASKEHQ